MTDGTRYDVTLAVIPEQRAAVVHGSVEHDGIGGFLGSAFGEVAGALAAQGGHPAGAPFARYRATDTGGWEVEAGFPVDGSVPVTGRVEEVVLPGGPAVRVLHRGPCAEVAGAYQAALRWVDDNGYRVTADGWELYLDGPEAAEPRTEVLLPCEPAHH